MPSIVPNARKTKVNFGGEEEGALGLRGEEVLPELGAALAAEPLLLLGAHLIHPLRLRPLLAERRLELVEHVLRDPLDREAVEARAEHAHRLERVDGVDRQVLVRGVRQVDEALLDVGLDLLHHPVVVVDQPAAGVAVVDGEVARVRVAVEEAVVAQLLHVRAREHRGDLLGREAALDERLRVGDLDAGQYSIVSTRDAQSSGTISGTFTRGTSRSSWRSARPTCARS